MRFLAVLFVLLFVPVAAFGDLIPYTMINGKSVTGLSLFIFRGPFSGGVITGPTFVPPVPPFPDRFNFQYSVLFSDGTLGNGALNTLQLVPEPSTFALLAIGIHAIPCAVQPHTSTIHRIR